MSSAEGSSPGEWLPIEAGGPDHPIQLARVGSRPLTGPFFHEDTQRLTEAHVVTRRVSAAELADCSSPDTRPPAAFIFHTGRCGSTLLVRMLMTDETNLVLGEPLTVSRPHRIGLISPDNATACGELRRSVIAATASFAEARGQRLIIKFTSWQAIDIATLASEYSDTPIVLLVRDPIQVVRSALDSMAGWAADLTAPLDEVRVWVPTLEGVSGPLTLAQRYAHVWRSTVEPALAYDRQRVLLVDYADLIGDYEHTLARLADHCGISSSLDLVRAHQALDTYSKSTGSEKFDPDGVHARPELTAATQDAVREITEDTWTEALAACRAHLPAERETDGTRTTK